MQTNGVVGEYPSETQRPIYMIPTLDNIMEDHLRQRDRHAHITTTPVGVPPPLRVGKSPKSLAWETCS